MTKPIVSVSWSSVHDRVVGMGGFECTLNAWLNPHRNRLVVMTSSTPIGDREELSRRGYSDSVAANGLYEIVSFKDWNDKPISEQHELGEFSVFSHHSPTWKNSSAWVAMKLGTYELDNLFEAAGFKTRPWRDSKIWMHALLSSGMYEMKIALGLIERPS